MTAPNANATPNANEPTPAPTASAPATGTPPWKAPDNGPDFLKGKSAEEVYNLSLQMAQQLQQQAQQAQQAPPVPGPKMPTYEDFVVRPDVATSAVVDNRLASALDPMTAQINTMAQLVASQTRGLAEQKFADDFKRWGPEINGLMSAMAPQQYTLDNIEKIIKYVRGNHIDEIAAEKAKAIMANGGFGERSGGTNGTMVSPNASAFDPSKLPPGYKELCERHGVTSNMVEDFCKANNWTPEQWMASAVNNKIFTNLSPFNDVMTDQQLHIKKVFGE